jgi:hypothetical protein
MQLLKDKEKRKREALNRILKKINIVNMFKFLQNKNNENNLPIEKKQ